MSKRHVCESKNVTGRQLIMRHNHKNYIGSPCGFVFGFLPNWENRKPHRTPKSEKPHFFCQKNEKPDAKKGKNGKPRRTKTPKNRSFSVQNPKNRPKRWPKLKNRKSQRPPLSIHPITGGETIKARHPIKWIRISWTNCRIYIFGRKMKLERDGMTGMRKSNWSQLTRGVN